MSASIPDGNRGIKAFGQGKCGGKGLECQFACDLIKSLSNLCMSLDDFQNFVINIQKLLPVLPEQLYAVLNLDLISLLLFFTFQSSFHGLALLKSHFASIVLFVSGGDEISYKALQDHTKELLKYNYAFISSISMKSLPRHELSTILICSELFTVVQRIPLEVVLEVIKKLQLSAPSNSVPSLFTLILNPSAPFLPAYPHKDYTLVLDLDETLGHLHQGAFLKRPGVELFLAELSTIYELVLFTASSQEYADCAMKVVDPEGLIVFRLYRDHLVSSDVKDLQLLGRELDKTIIIDNYPKSFEKQPKNGIAIKAWLGDQNDQELAKLLWPLREIPFVRGKSLYEMLEIINMRL